MRYWHPRFWPLRVRVALAFLAATTVAMIGFGAFVQARVSGALDERLRDTVEVEFQRLSALPGRERAAAMRSLVGEVHAQELSADGDVRVSSPLVLDSLTGPGGAVAVREGGDGWREATVSVVDEGAPGDERRDPERERLVLLVGPVEDGVLVVGTSRDDADEALAALRAQLLIAGPVVLAVAGGLGYLVAGAALRPIERMRERAATISSRSAAERLPVPAANDELQRLAATLNAMLERLDEGLQRERRFAAEAGHDIRTPLTLMLTEIELALAQHRTPEELTESLRSIDVEVRRLISLAEELLERSGVEGTTLTIEAEPLDLAALATRVADRFRAASGGRAIRVTSPTTVEIRGDATRLDRALSNLVDNAIRHGSGDIVIEVGARRGVAVVDVVDAGPGPDGTANASGGGGLGLSIVEEIVRAHGGSMEMRRSDGRTRVRVELPTATEGARGAERVGSG